MKEENRSEYGKELTRENEFLGVTFDKKLKFNKHISKKDNKSDKLKNTHISCYKTTIYKSMIRPLMTYSLEV